MSMADQGGGGGVVIPISLIFMQFSEKILPNNNFFVLAPSRLGNPGSTTACICIKRKH